MKIISLSLGIVLLNFFTSVSFYDLQFESIDGAIIKTSAYQGKKCIITVVSANTASVNLVRYLDSVQKANTNIQVIAVPTGDFSGSIKAQDLKDLKKNISIVITQPLKVTKANATLQHPLFAWLTKNDENKHFNMDVSGEGQIFIVSAKGTLYSVLPKGTPFKVLGKAINQNFAE